MIDQIQIPVAHQAHLQDAEALRPLSSAAAARLWSLRTLPGSQLFFPLVHQRPIDGTGPEIGHVLIALQASDRGIEQASVLAKDGAVTRQQPGHIALPNPLQGRKDIECFCEAPVLERRRVKDSGGHYEKRYVIQTTAKLGAVSWPIKITLANRDPMLFRMLLGRTAVENRFLINPGWSYRTGRKLAKAYQTKKINKAQE